jgi:hypothetical protein
MRFITYGGVDWSEITKGAIPYAGFCRDNNGLSSIVTTLSSVLKDSHKGV